MKNNATENRSERVITPRSRSQEELPGLRCSCYVVVRFCYDLEACNFVRATIVLSNTNVTTEGLSLNGHETPADETANQN
jgi:hypothetical protein